MENVVMKNLGDGVLTRSFWELLCEKQEWVFFSSLKSQRFFYSFIPGCFEPGMREPSECMNPECGSQTLRGMLELSDFKLGLTLNSAEEVTVSLYSDVLMPNHRDWIGSVTCIVMLGYTEG